MPANDFLTRFKSDLAGPSASFAAVVPHNTTNLTVPTRGLFIGVAGNVSVVPLASPSTSVVFKNVAAGSVLPVAALRVNATGTTATDIVALY